MRNGFFGSIEGLSKQSINYCIDISELIIVVIGCRRHDLECSAIFKLQLTGHKDHSLSSSKILLSEEIPFDGSGSVRPNVGTSGPFHFHSCFWAF